MEGLSSLTKLRKLDLSFNKIAKLEGILTNHMLEIIELGKNLLTDVDCIQSPNNRLIFLSELYLYDNQLRSLPKGLTFPQLKVLNINRN